MSIKIKVHPMLRNIIQLSLASTASSQAAKSYEGMTVLAVPRQTLATGTARKMQTRPPRAFF